VTLAYEDVVAILAPDEPTEAGMQLLDQSAVPHLERLLQSDDLSLQVKAAFALARVPSERTTQLVSELAEHSLPVMRVAAAAAARALPPVEREAVLLTLLRDGDPGVQKSALKSVAAEVSEEFNAQLAALEWADAGLVDLATRTLSNIRVMPGLGYTPSGGT